MIIEALLARYMRRFAGRHLRFPVGDGEGIEWFPQAVPGRAYLLYLHIPFCEELCPYCTFNRVKIEDRLAASYFAALEREVLLYRERGFRFREVYVGGGTPTIRPAALGKLLDTVRALWKIRRISVETNPNHLTPEILAVLQQSGVNRLSVGVQSFHDGILRDIGRLERYGSGRSIAERLQAVRGQFDTVNVDLIFNYPQQTEEMLRGDLDRLLELEPDQITYYPLMAGRLTRQKMSALGPVRYDREKRFYGLIRAALERRYSPSSAWCFSRAGEPDRPIDEYIVEHEEYAGLGAGAFGYLGASTYTNAFFIPRYIELIESGASPIVARRTFSHRERIRYDFLMKLFGASLNLQQLSAKYADPVAPHLWWALAFLRLQGALRRRGTSLELTRRGQYFWVVLMREFFIGVNNFREACLALGGS